MAVLPQPGNGIRVRRKGRQWIMKTMCPGISWANLNFTVTDMHWKSFSMRSLKNRTSCRNVCESCSLRWRISERLAATNRRYQRNSTAFYTPVAGEKCESAEI